MAPIFAVSWPTGEFGGMGLEGAVKLGYRNELAAIADPAERKAEFDDGRAHYERGKALNAATLFEIDEVIDPAETRRWIMGGLKSLPPRRREPGRSCAGSSLVMNDRRASACISEGETQCELMEIICPCWNPS